MTMQQDHVQAAIPAVRPPRGYVTPECFVGALQPDPEWPGGHPKCRAPGYTHPVLGEVPVPCACECHLRVSLKKRAA